ncbi:MAG TPA: glycosyl hydrolase family 18 protein [Ilumatobacteraceae bacterium]
MDDTPEAPPRRPRRASARAESVRRVVLVCLLGAVVLAVIGGYAVTTHKSPWKRSGPPITVSAWAPYWQTDAATASLTANIGAFSDVSLFAFHATAAASVTPYDGLDPNASAGLRTVTAGAGVKLTASIVDDTGAHTMAGIIADPTQRATHVATITQLAMADGFDGIDLDYENFAFNDGRSTWDTTRPNWVEFVTELAAALHAQGKTLSVSVPPVYDSGHTDDSGYWVYDMGALGKVVDHIRLMAYDYSTSSAGPIAPIAWVKKVIKAAKDLVPPAKLVLGIPAYGYDWPASVSGTCPADQQPKRHDVSTASAAALVASKDAVAYWDPAAGERIFTYSEQLLGTDATGGEVTCSIDHAVWFEDAQAIHDRAWLAERQGLGGISLWALGDDDAATWEGLAAARADIATWPLTGRSTPTSTTLPATTVAASTSAVSITSVAPPTTVPGVPVVSAPVAVTGG